MLLLSMWKNRVIPSGLRWTPSFATCLSLIRLSRRITGPIAAKRLLITWRNPLLCLKVRAGSLNLKRGGTSTSRTSTTPSACSLSTKLVMADRMPSTVDVEEMSSPPTPPLRCGAEYHHLSVYRLVVRRRPHSPSPEESDVHVSQLKQKDTNLFHEEVAPINLHLMPEKCEFQTFPHLDALSVLED